MIVNLKENDQHNREVSVEVTNLVRIFDLGHVY